MKNLVSQCVDQGGRLSGSVEGIYALYNYTPYPIPFTLYPMPHTPYLIPHTPHQQRIYVPASGHFAGAYLQALL